MFYMPVYESIKNADNKIVISPKNRDSAVFGWDKVIAARAEKNANTIAIDGWYGIDYEKIAKLLIDEFIPSLRDKGIRLTVDEDVPACVAAEADGGVRGARDIRHTIRKAIEDPIANILVAGYDKIINEIRVSVFDGKIVVTHS